ncbi:hypothetical protein BpHYR1_035078 [Brachionus plicatilis]|uniref:Uncharacterized protein n=1 Tax=Brachionus plicatilis TaxID=10195 RepID=A0A3M7SZC6_BRAPC|nr:hypothetical protein BpHYR1_035078 [Brachionus plicatilis]
MLQETSGRRLLLFVQTSIKVDVFNVDHGRHLVHGSSCGRGSSGRVLMIAHVHELFALELQFGVCGGRDIDLVRPWELKNPIGLLSEHPTAAAINWLTLSLPD